MNTKNVTKYPSAKATVGENILLIKELERIQTGYYASLIIPCRQAYTEDKIQYSKLKTNLPAITFCGTFLGAHKKENISSYNNLILIDVDHIVPDKISEIKSILVNDRYVTSCWISPSGQGLKVLLKIESDQIAHKFYFDQVVEYLFSNYGVKADLSGCDVCRLCFVSFDKDLYYDNNKCVFPKLDIGSWSSNTKESGLIRPKKRTNNNFNIAKSESLLKHEARLFNETEGKNKRSDRDLAKKIVTYLRKKGESITREYSSWLKVGFAISNSFTYEVGLKIFLELCRLDGAEHDEDKSTCLLQHCYRVRRIHSVNFASILYMASQKGFITIK